jgi:hypothetical protein
VIRSADPSNCSGTEQFMSTELEIDSLDDLKVTELKELLKERGLATDGKKQLLVERLKGYLQEQEEESKKRKLEEADSVEGDSSNKKQKLDHGEGVWH